MQKARISVHQDKLICPICLDVLKDPVTIPCGHNYCMGCIKTYWDQDDDECRCPQCRQNFKVKPVLHKNTMLAEMLENLETDKPNMSESEPGDEECDTGVGGKIKAVKLNFGIHKITDDTGEVQGKICSSHGKVLEVYCRTDQQCICYLCTLDKHKGHDSITAAAERSEKQKQIESSHKEVQQRIQENEMKLQEMKKSVDSFTHSAEAMAEDGENIFTELISFVQNGRSEFKKTIADQEKAKVTEAVGVREQLEQNLTQLRKIKNEMEYLSRTQDHIYFLQSFKSLCQLPKHEDLPKIAMNSCCFSEGLMMSVFGLQEKLEDCCKKKLADIGQKVNIETVLLTPEARIRGLFLQHACQLSLDNNTVHENLSLFNNDTEVIRDGDTYNYPYHPERFDSVSQVLCKEGLSGCCYWEVQWSGEVYIGVSYKEIGRKGSGSDCCLGHNDKSWSLHCSSSKCCFRYNNSKTSLPLSSCPRIGVYLDHKGGILSFYRVSDIMTLIHRVQTTFTQPLYPGFRLFFPIFGSAENIITLCPLIE